MASREGDYDAVKKDIVAIMDQEDYDDGSAGESRLPGHVAQPLLFWVSQLSFCTQDKDGLKVICGRPRTCPASLAFW